MPCPMSTVEAPVIDAHIHRPTENVPVAVYQRSEEVARVVAQAIAELVREKPDAVLGLATGSTPIGVYRHLVEMHREDGLDFSGVTTVNLDEYHLREGWNDRSYRAFMDHHLFKHIDIDPDRTFLPPSHLASKSDISRACREYEKRIVDLGGIDLQLLGIGGNGHIGFNEPGTDVDMPTHYVRLNQSTRKDAASDFGSLQDTPTHAITMGTGTIMEHCKRVILMATGEKKAPIIQQAVEGLERRDIPATALHQHRDVTFVLDASAAGSLSRVAAPWTMSELNLNWSEIDQRRATIWLSHHNGKPISRLTERDYRAVRVREKPTAFAQHNREILDSVHAPLWTDPGEFYAQSTGRERHTLVVSSFAPHPDDTEISMGATAAAHCDQGDQVHVAIMTSGNIAVSDNDLLKFLRGTHHGRSFSDRRAELEVKKKKGGKDSLWLRNAKARMRQVECENGCHQLGVSKDRVIGLELPFYETGEIEKAPPTQKDIDIVKNRLMSEQPHMIYAAGDLTDPHGTHRTCLQILLKAIEQLRVEGQGWIDRTLVCLYRGAWQEYEIHEMDLAVPFSKADAKRKRRAIREHHSQVPHALFPGNDPRPFDKRAWHRNHGTATQYKQLGIEGFSGWRGGRQNYGVEGFKVYRASEIRAEMFA